MLKKEDRIREFLFICTKVWEEQSAKKFSKVRLPLKAAAKEGKLGNSSCMQEEKL